MNKMTLKAIKANKGATLNNNGEAMTYKTGFQVSKRDLYIIPVKQLTKRLITATLAVLRDDECLGIWIDGGRAYVDMSERISNYKHALKVGRDRKQISVWSWNKGEAVTC